MRSRGLGVVVLAAGLSACATGPVETPTVTIYSNQPGHARTLDVAERLEAAGYRHDLGYTELPAGLETAATVIVRGRSAAAAAQARRLQTLLSSDGQRVQIQRGGLGRHPAAGDRPVVYVFVPEAGREPDLKVRAHLAGSCKGTPVALFLFIDASYRLEHRRRQARATLVGGVHERGDWSPDGSGFRMRSAGDRDWALEPPLEDDPAVRSFFVRGHPELAGCRLSEPL